MEHALCAQNFSVLVRQQIKALVPYVLNYVFLLQRTITKLLIYFLYKE